jgi:hypothetical protein
MSRDVSLSAIRIPAGNERAANLGFFRALATLFPAGRRCGADVQFFLAKPAEICAFARPKPGFAHRNRRCMSKAADAQERAWTRQAGPLERNTLLCI